MSQSSKLSAPWRHSRPWRIAGSGASWLIFSLAFTLLYLYVTTLLTANGACSASGNLGEAPPCPEAVAGFAPAGVIGCIVAVAIGIWISQGFGTRLVVFAWPIVCTGLGSLFLLAFAASLDVAGLIFGIVLLVAGLAPLAAELRGGAQRALLGTVNLDGQRFAPGPLAGPTLLADGAPASARGSVEPKPVDWAASFGILAVASTVGYLLARAIFFAV